MLCSTKQSFPHATLPRRAVSIWHFLSWQQILFQEWQGDFKVTFQKLDIIWNLFFYFLFLLLVPQDLERQVKEWILGGPSGPRIPFFPWPLPLNVLMPVIPLRRLGILPQGDLFVHRLLSPLLLLPGGCCSAPVLDLRICETFLTCPKSTRRCLCPRPGCEWLRSHFVQTRGGNFHCQFKGLAECKQFWFIGFFICLFRYLFVCFASFFLSFFAFFSFLQNGLTAEVSTR